MLFTGKRWRVSGFVVLNVILAALVASPASAFAAARLQAQAGTPAGEVRMLGSDAHGVSVELAAPAFALAAPADDAGKVACQQAQAAGFVQSEEVGRPQLPVKVVLLGVPSDAKLTLDVDASPARTLASGVALCAAQPLSPADPDQAAQAAAPARDLAVFGVDRFYPGESVRMIDLGFMRSQRIVRLEFYPVQFNPVTGVLRVNDRLEATVRFDQGTNLAAATASAGTVTEPDEFETAFRGSLLNYETARAFRGTAAPALAAAAADPAVAWMPPTLPAYKISVRDTGIYQLTRDALTTAGLPVDQIDPHKLRMFNGGQEVALRVIGEEDGKFDAGDLVLFYGQGVQGVVKTRYTDTNIYWLTYGGATGLRMDTRASLAEWDQSYVVSDLDEAGEERGLRLQLTDAVEF